LPCDQNSKLCLNGATCANDNKGGYKCTCDNGYTGENCEIGNSQGDFFTRDFSDPGWVIFG